MLTRLMTVQKDLAMDMGYSSQDVVDQGPRGTEIKAEVQEDYSKVEVYYQTLNVQSIIQEAKYSVWVKLSKYQHLPYPPPSPKKRTKASSRPSVVPSVSTSASPSSSSLSCSSSSATCSSVDGDTATAVRRGQRRSSDRFKSLMKLWADRSICQLLCP